MVVTIVLEPTPRQRVVSDDGAEREEAWLKKHLARAPERDEEWIRRAMVLQGRC